MRQSNSAADLKIIIDSNVLIAVEDHDEIGTAYTAKAAELVQLVSRAHASLLIVSGTRDDVLRAEDSRRLKRLAQIAKYHILERPAIRPDLAVSAGFPFSRSPNDESDLEILAALDVGAADWLVTDDIKLRRRAARAGYADSVFSLQEAVETLRGFIHIPSSIPNIRTVHGHQIELTAVIFDSVKLDYPGFVDWWRRKVVYEGRDVLIIGEGLSPEGVSVLKVELDQPYQLESRVLKICTFKVDDPFIGSRRGELLLNASVDYARKNDCSQIYLEVFSEKTPFVEWLQLFGFERLPNATTERHEWVLAKTIDSSAAPDTRLSPLDYNIAFGPGRLVVQNPLLVPIISRWRRRLLPEQELQTPLFQYSEPCGNAIRKAYLCNASIRSMKPGDTLLSYETHGRSAVISVGVMESHLVSQDSHELMRYVGNRTVYSPQDIAKICRSREVLAIRFRFDRTLEVPWSKETLIGANAMSGAPRSVQRVKQGGLEWVRMQLAK